MCADNSVRVFLDSCCRYAADSFWITTHIIFVSYSCIASNSVLHTFTLFFRSKMSVLPSSRGLLLLLLLLAVFATMNAGWSQEHRASCRLSCIHWFPNTLVLIKCVALWTGYFSKAVEAIGWMFLMHAVFIQPNGTAPYTFSFKYHLPVSH